MTQMRFNEKIDNSVEAIMRRLARTSDPTTSHQSAHALVATGKLGRLAKEMLELVIDHPGLTSGEYGRLTTMDGHWKRLSDLKNAGLVYQGEPRKYRNRNQCTWWPK